jgi:hypothetical protein
MNGYDFGSIYTIILTIGRLAIGYDSLERRCFCEDLLSLRIVFGGI